MENTTTLIAYFSRKRENYINGSFVNLSIGNTASAANIIKSLTNGDIFEIEPVNKYSESYYPCTKEAKDELNRNTRPELVTYLNSIEVYDNVILGYPNWWGTMPMPVFTFLEKYDFSGKTIIPFCTHEGSGMGRSVKDIQKTCPQAHILKGLPIRGSDAKNAGKEIQEWLKGLDIL